MILKRVRIMVLSLLLAVSVFPAIRAETEPSGEEAPAPTGRMYDLGSQELWDEVVAVLKVNKLSPERIDKENGTYSTYMKRLKSKTLAGLTPPSAKERLKLDSFQFHVFVPRHIEPGRVYVSVITEGLGKKHFYSHGIDGYFQSWFFDRLSEKLGKEGTPIPPDGQERKGLERSFLGEEEPRECDRYSGAEPLVPGFQEVTNPQIIQASRIDPMDPDRFAGVTSGSVLVQALVDEEGRVAETRVLRNLTGSEEFGVSVADRVSFWRYHPAELNGCPVPVRTMISVEF